MSISEPMFYINVKNSGKKCHKFIFGEHSFYRRTLKSTGYATFSCTEKQCKATMSCKYLSEESAIENDTVPEILR